MGHTVVIESQDRHLIIYSGPLAERGEVLIYQPLRHTEEQHIQFTRTVDGQCKYQSWSRLNTVFSKFH